MRKILSVLLCLALLLPMTICGEESTITISSVDEFFAFAENCRLDSYSVGLTVTLEQNLNLMDVPFSPIPIFSGTFDGQGHTISGVSIAADGSYTGLFRKLETTATVKNLTVQGTITAGGSGDLVGGIAGRSSGLIENCHFSGQLVGVDAVGGIVGLNTLTGTVDSCTARGSIQGDHFVGGIAGQNLGVIRICKNSAEINTTAAQNSVDISDITLDYITDSESAATVTDIGGIAGQSGGVIRDSENSGNVGYRQMGYNIGGIAGSHSGYITACVNRGTIFGRKEVGGIVGQMEPAVSMVYSEDTLQILQEQMDTMAYLTDRTAGTVQSGASALEGQVGELEQQVTDAQIAIEQLLPKEEDAAPPDADSILAAQNALSSSLSAMTDILGRIASTGESTVAGTTNNIQAMSDQMNAISGTLGAANENLNGSVTDISDADTDEDTTSKVDHCINYGAVQAEWNTGGIAGALSLENDLDPEADVQLLGNSSLNFDLQLRGVIAYCENQGIVEGKKQNTGGIAGWMALGLIRDCVSTGSVSAENASYTGGIAGLSDSFIRRCQARGAITGSAYTGGIAGMGSTVSDSRAMVLLSGKEKTGAILGWEAEDADITANHYLAIGSDAGGIDGISYEDRAQAASPEEFFAEASIPESFRSFTVRFVFGDGSVQTVAVPYGSALQPQDVPALPEIEGSTGRWEGLEAAMAELNFDTVVTAVYTQHATTVASEACSSEGKPLVLAVGQFPGGTVTLTDVAYPDALESYALALPEGTATSLRCLCPQGYAPEDIRLMVHDGKGTWSEIPFTADGSYLVFSAQGVQAIAMLEAVTDHSLWIWVGAGILAAAVIAVTLIMVHKRRK